MYIMPIFLISITYLNMDIYKYLLEKCGLSWVRIKNQGSFYTKKSINKLFFRVYDTHKNIIL